jgi:hypothetical protein
MLIIVHLRIGVRWNLSCTKNTLTSPFCLPLVIGPFLSMEVLCRLWLWLLECGTNWDQLGQTRGCGEYKMGRSGRDLVSCLGLRGSSSRLCRLMTDHLALVSKFNYVLVHTGLMGSCKLTSFIGH